ncbi:MAG: hypothetical protein J7524_22840 [Roseofilum sp. Belize BBD 4]|uniref:hypothetical protein n=1 Tax=Roseofilum sp. Belize BBD 4 TaxID=2821500 RepID=UPI001B038AA8|nr:hypothetical protein [Roseofilum sp. Belize BBD 4]MBP0035961.1 hypothetical protein [Roseofilum sp. Belize BBD 4]
MTKDIKIGLIMNPEEGLKFFGLEEVNNLLSKGEKIIKIEPEGAILEEVSRDSEGIEVELNGFALIVKLEDN